MRNVNGIEEKEFRDFNFKWKDMDTELVNWIDMEFHDPEDYVLIIDHSKGELQVHLPL